jgi:hypothetical protein
VEVGPVTGVALVQPTRRRAWELRRGEEVVAELQLHMFKRGGEARLGGRELEIRAHGTLRPEHVLVDAATQEELARVRGRTVELEGGERAEWKSLGRGQGYGLVGADGEPWLRGKVRSGLVRTSGEIEVADGHEVALPALLAAYLLIRRAEQAAASASGAVVIT